MSERIVWVVLLSSMLEVCKSPSVTAPGLEPQRSVNLKVSAVRVFL